MSVPGGVSVSGASLIGGSSLVSIGACVGGWGSFQLDVLSMAWIRSIHSLGWLSSSSRSDSVPSRVTSGTASLILGGGLVSVNTSIGVGKGVSFKSKLNMLSMSWVWSIHSLGWLGSSGRGNCVPGGVSGSGASLICSSGLVSIHTGVSFWESITLLEKLEMLGMSWIWGSHGVSWLSGSGGGNCVPS